VIVFIKIIRPNVIYHIFTTIPRLLLCTSVPYGLEIRGRKVFFLNTRELKLSCGTWIMMDRTFTMMDEITGLDTDDIADWTEQDWA